MATGTQQTHTQVHTAMPIFKAVLAIMLVLGAIGAMFLLDSYTQDKIDHYDTIISDATSDTTPPSRFSALDNAPLNPSANPSDWLASNALQHRLTNQLIQPFMFIALTMIALLGTAVFISQLVRISFTHKGRPLPEGESKKMQYNSKKMQYFYFLAMLLFAAGVLLWFYTSFQLPESEKGTLCAGLLWSQCQQLYDFPGTDVAGELMMAQAGIGVMAIGAMALVAVVFTEAARGKIW